MPRKKKNNQYFTKETEEWIQTYIKEESKHKKDLIYLKYLDKPIRTIAEVYYSKMSTDYIEEGREDAINDCISMLMTVAIYHLDNKKGKAYSYLSVSARNHFIQLNNKNYTRLKRFKTEHLPEDFRDYLIDENIDNHEYNKEFLEKFYAFIEWFRERMKDIPMYKQRREQVLAMLDYMENFESDTFFKKDMLKEIYERYGFREDNYSLPRTIIALNMQHFFRQWDEENYNPDPLHYQRSLNILTKIDETKKHYIRQHYERCSHQNGARGLSRRLNLPEDIIRKFAMKEGLH